jgi:CheY-like chemotaxis protein
MKRRRRSARPPRTPSAPAPDAGPLILIVEDNGDLRELYSTYFTFHGFRAQTASDGQIALAHAVEYTPDLIVTDLSMPHLGGWEMTRRLKNDPRTAHIPVIACTGDALGSSAERALDAGCDAYVVKPCLPEDLLGETRRLLERSPASRRSA